MPVENPATEEIILSHAPREGYCASTRFIPSLEYTVLAMPVEAAQNPRTHGVSACGSPPSFPIWGKVIERSPPGAAFGREHMFFNLHKALEAWQRISDRSSPTEG